MRSITAELHVRVVVLAACPGVAIVHGSLARGLPAEQCIHLLRNVAGAVAHRLETSYVFTVGR